MNKDNVKGRTLRTQRQTLRRKHETYIPHRNHRTQDRNTQISTYQTQPQTTQVTQRQVATVLQVQVQSQGCLQERRLAIRRKLQTNHEYRVHRTQNKVLGIKKGQTTE